MKTSIVTLLVLVYLVALTGLADESGKKSGQAGESVTLNTYAEVRGEGGGVSTVKEGTLLLEGTVQKQGEGSDGGDAQGKKTGEEVRVEVRIRNDGKESNLTLREEVRETAGAGINIEIEVGNMTREREQETLETRNETMRRLRNQTPSGGTDPIELRERLRERILELNRTFRNLSGTKKDVYMNQSRITLALHAFLDVENMTGGIAGNVPEIARGFNESLQATIRAEERIRKRDGFTRFFFGGDANAAKDIERELERYRERIQELSYIAAKCECDAETRTLLKEQLRTIEEEQKRLQDLADKEKKDKGFIGWLWKKP
ncbi:MAG: hypothetical protein JW724_05490 [Candidatus Altiarchaeota archaeon]|nr:hypothetical protein [Candidatus Altiarchaeota archaeon]